VCGRKRVRQSLPWRNKSLSSPLAGVSTLLCCGERRRGYGAPLRRHKRFVLRLKAPRLDLHRRGAPQKAAPRTSVGAGVEEGAEEAPDPPCSGIVQKLGLEQEKVEYRSWVQYRSKV
jgi:hypothetical protein